jgi:hypothetical protein
MKAFTVHGVFKIARFTDAPCIRQEMQEEQKSIEPSLTTAESIWVFISSLNVLNVSVTTGRE